MSSERIQRLTDVWRRRGAVVLGSWIAYRMAKRLVNARIARVLWLDRQSLATASAADAAHADEDLAFRFLTTEDVGRWAGDPANDLPASLTARLAPGKDHCFAAVADGQLAGYAWFALRRIEPEHAADADISYPDDVAYLYKGYVREGFRGRRLYAAIIERALEHLAERGVRRLFCLVEWTNEAALRSSLHGGWSDLGRLVTLGYGRHRVILAPREAHDRGLRFGCRA